VFYRGKQIPISPDVAHQISLRAAEIVRRTAPVGPNNSRRLVRATWQRGQIGIHIPPQAIHLLYLDQGIQPFVMTALEGKAQGLDEPILTPRGWVPMGLLAVGDEVIGSSGQATRIVRVFPQGELEQYLVNFSDGTFARCSGDHLWTVRRRNLYHRTVSTEYLSRMMHETWSVDTPGPIEFSPGGVLPIHPYLLGVLLGDGCIVSASPAISAGEGEEAVIDEVKKVLPEEFSMYRSNSYPNSSVSWRIVAGKKGWNAGGYHGKDNQRNPLSEALRKLNLWGKRAWEKHIPEEYLFASIRDRLMVLQGLLDTDGHCQLFNGVPYVGFTSTSKDLADGVANLARSLGGRASVNTCKRFRQDRTCWRVTLSLPQDLIPFRAPLEKRLNRYLTTISNRKGKADRKYIQSVVAEGVRVPMQCISVEAEDGLYVTSGYTLTHNTIPIRGPNGSISFRVAKNVGKPQILTRDEGGKIIYSKIRWRFPGVEPMNFIQPALTQAIQEYFRSMKSDDMVEALQNSGGELGKFFGRFKKVGA